MEHFIRSLFAVIWPFAWYKPGDVLERIDNRRYESWERREILRIQIKEVGHSKYRIIHFWDLAGNSSGPLEVERICYIHCCYKKVKSGGTNGI